MREHRQIGIVGGYGGGGGVLRGGARGIFGDNPLGGFAGRLGLGGQALRIGLFGFFIEIQIAHGVFLGAGSMKNESVADYNCAAPPFQLFYRLAGKCFQAAG